MSYETTPNDTIELFVMAGVVTLGALIAYRYFTAKFLGGLVAAIVVGGLFWELPYGYFNYDRLCRNETRLLVFEKTPPQEAVCLDVPDGETIGALLRRNFEIIEVPEKYGDSFRKMRSVPKQIRVGRKFSSYCVVYENNFILPWDVQRASVLIVRANDRHVVARMSSFTWKGMWWQRLMSPILGVGGSCYSKADDPFSALRKGLP